jgi:hypothetical protein
MEQRQEALDVALGLERWEAEAGSALRALISTYLRQRLGAPIEAAAH